ncbi:MAG: Fic family protein [Actinobacteria bacterium]|nr:Fic family protein [Actinomycetota bacterium]
MEERIKFEQIGPALRKIVARLEAISTIRIDGKDPNLRMLIELESMEKTDSETDRLYSRSMLTKSTEEALAIEEASREALWYMQTLEWLSECIEPGSKIHPETLLEIHSRCVYGESAMHTGVKFREKAYRVPEDLIGIYQPPAPEDVIPLIEDLCSFINRDIYTPNTQAALAHFQFESIKPFKRGLDRTGRAMAHAIIYRRGLVENIIPPIGLMPAIHTQYHAEHLLPYGFGFKEEGQTKAKAIDEWARFCGHSIELAARVVKAYIDAIVDLEISWNQRLGKTNKGSAIQELLLVLPGRPLLTVSSAMKLIDRSFSATNDALDRLEQSGILRITGDASSRNRVFEAKEVFDAVDEMERHLLVQSPVSRDSFFPKE